MGLVGVKSGNLEVVGLTDNSCIDFASVFEMNTGKLRTSVFHCAAICCSRSKTQKAIKKFDLTSNELSGTFDQIYSARVRSSFHVINQPSLCHFFPHTTRSTLERLAES